MSTPKIVKRYANRKLYDTNRSCYVTLDDIAQMIRAGDDVQVIDNKTGDDLTSVTLVQVIFETEKKNNFMSLSLLRRLIREGGDALGEFARDRALLVQSKAAGVKQSASKLRLELEERVSRAIGRADGDAGDEGELAMATAPGTADASGEL